MMPLMRNVQGIAFPSFLYGTAWKEDATEACVASALAAGFRGIDTANQRKHYFEEGAGRAIARAIADGHVTREELFIQTKFTFARGQDQRLPYDPKAPVATQVEQSFNSSLEHLRVTYLDSLVLHGPTHAQGLAPEDHEAWAAMEKIHATGGARLIGISNVAADQLKLLIEAAKVRPAFVQNRCYARDGWDEEVRSICDAKGVVYQGFSLLTANPKVVASATVAKIAEHHRRSREAIVFRFALDLGMLPLTGTKNPERMKIDLDSERIALSLEDRKAILAL